MKIDRREFIGAVVGATLLGKSAYAQTDPAPKGFSILQGMTDETSAQFSVVVPAGAWSYEVVRQDGVGTQLAVSQAEFGREFSPYQVHRLLVEGLELGATYLLRVKDQTGKAQDEREFRALDRSARNVKLAFLSCQLDLFHDADVWRKFDEANPDCAFFIGDNVYADRTSLISKRPANEKQLWERYVLTRNKVAFYFQRRLKPVIATWDDHDYGADNAGAEFEHKEHARIIFETFFAQQPRQSLERGPGVATRFSAFGADFLLLDGRYFRGTGGKMFGDEQEAWMLQQLRGGPAWILSGSLFFGGYYGDGTFEGDYGSDFRNFIDKVKTTQSVVCFGSGDVHYSEYMSVEAAQLGYPTFEMVASGMHSYTFWNHENRFNNPRRVAASSQYNFMLFDGRFESQKIEGTLTCIGGGGPIFQANALAQR